MSRSKKSCLLLIFILLLQLCSCSYGTPSIKSEDEELKSKIVSQNNIGREFKPVEALSDVKTPKDAMNFYIYMVKNQQYDKIYSILADANKKTVKQDAYIKLLKLNDETVRFEDIQAIENDMFANHTIEGNSYERAFKYTVYQTYTDLVDGKVHNASGEKYVVYENGSWRIYGEGLKDYNKLLSDKYNDIGYMYLLGEGKPKDIQAGMSMLDEGLKYNKNNSLCYYNYAAAYEELGDFDKAEKYAQIAIEKAEDNERKSRSYCILGNVYEDKGQKNEAVKAYNKALDINPGNDVAKGYLQKIQ